MRLISSTRGSTVIWSRERESVRLPSTAGAGSAFGVESSNSAARGSLYFGFMKLAPAELDQPAETMSRVPLGMAAFKLRFVLLKLHPKWLRFLRHMIFG